MAEIKLERKPSSTWPIVAAVLVVIALIWAVFAMFGDVDTPVTDAPAASEVPGVPDPNRAPLATPAPAMPPPAVASFLTFADSPPGDTPGPAHDYSADGIRRLTAAMRAVIDRDTVDGEPIRTQFAAFQQKADRIQADPTATSHAAQVREVFTSAADLMAALPADRWPAGSDRQARLASMREAAIAVDATRPLLDQTDAVRTFFARAADSVRAVSEHRSAAGSY